MGIRGDRARSVLIDNAERLFAEHGIEAVSLRDVSKAAGQRKHSAAQYHFGDRAGLVAAVYEARMGTINARRAEHVRELRAEGRERDLDALVAAIVVPLVDFVTESHGWYGRFLARTHWDTFAGRVLADLDVRSSLREVLGHLTDLMSDLPAAVRRSRLEHVNTLLIGTVAGWEWARDRGDRMSSAQFLTSDLIATSVAILTAASAPAFT